ncbi:MAG: restriction endonuclease subunit S [Burkholderiales bacterium]|nr:restriction endonuclease subunit S [Burkholderiales bacterium]
MAGEWQTVPLDSLIESNRGISYGIVQPGSPVADGVPIVRVSDVRNGRVTVSAPLRVAPAIEAAYARTRLTGGELLLTIVGTVGEAAIAPASLAGWNTARAIAVIPVRKDIGAYWVKLALQAPGVREMIDSRLNTTVQATLNLGDVAKLPIVMPPCRERKAITHILSTLDDKIELNRLMSETLDAMARALFKSWFVNFDPVCAKAEGRDPGLPRLLADPFPARFVDSKLGKIPEGWEVGELGELVETVRGRSYKSEELVESDTALVTLKSFARGGGYRRDGLKSFAGTYKAEQVVNPGEVVIACTDVTQTAEVIGRPAIVRGTSGYRRLVASLDTMIVRPRDSRVTRAFLYFLGGTEAFVAHTYAHTTGTTVLHLAKEAVPSFTFARPPIQLVEKFDALAAPTLDRIQALEEESGTLTALRDALLPKLVSGELRVSSRALCQQVVRS